MPTISIITPAYNCEKYLEEAVESVLAQTMQDWEMLIIDDCSSDNTYDCMENTDFQKYTEHRCRSYKKLWDPSGKGPVDRIP